MDVSVEYVYPSQNPRHDAALKPCAPGSSQACLWGADGLSFKDIFDTINLLQQLPIISSLYRSSTGDTISAGARMIGGALLGGPIGFIASAIGAGIEAASGKDLGEHLVAWFDDASPAATAATAARKYGQAKILS